MNFLLKLSLILSFFFRASYAQDRRPTISFITQPEIVTDIGGTVEMKCSVQYGEDYPVVWMKLDPVDRNNDLPITSGESQNVLGPSKYFEQDQKLNCSWSNS